MLKINQQKIKIKINETMNPAILFQTKSNPIPKTKKKIQKTPFI
jgi:hypothetical protein